MLIHDEPTGEISLVRDGIVVARIPGIVEAKWPGTAKHLNDALRDIEINDLEARIARIENRLREYRS